MTYELTKPNVGTEYVNVDGGLVYPALLTRLETYRDEVMGFERWVELDRETVAAHMAYMWWKPVAARHLREVDLLDPKVYNDVPAALPPVVDVCDDCHHRDDPEVFGSPCGQCGPDAIDIPTKHSRRADMVAARAALRSPVVSVWGCTQGTIEEPGVIVTYLDFDGTDPDVDGINVETKYYFPFPTVAGFDVYVFTPAGDDMHLQADDIENNLDELARSWHDAEDANDDEPELTRCGTCASFTHYGTAPSGRGWGRCEKGGMNVSVNDYPGYGCYDLRADGPEWAMGGSS